MSPTGSGSLCVPWPWPSRCENSHGNQCRFSGSVLLTNPKTTLKNPKNMSGYSSICQETCPGCILYRVFHDFSKQYLVFHGFSMVFSGFFPWFFHGFSMVLPWFFHGFSMVLPWFFHGFPWFFHSFPWFFHGLFLHSLEFGRTTPPGPTRAVPSCGRAPGTAGGHFSRWEMGYNGLKWEILYILILTYVIY